MSRRKRELSDGEKALWSRVAKTVTRRRSAKPLAAPAGEPDAPPPSSRVAVAGAPAKNVLARAAKSPAHAKPVPPPDRSGEKRVRRGRLDIGASLDLHGHTQASGRAALERFLRQAQAAGHAAVIVITGVGRSGGGVLKRRLPDWLAEPELRPHITGYAPAHRGHGGAGAFYVFIRRSRETRP